MMIIKSTLALAAAIAAIGIASPTFAQSAFAANKGVVAFSQSGRHAFAMVRDGALSDSGYGGYVTSGYDPSIRTQR